MTKSFKARFDGKVFIPEEPVDLPVGQTLEVSVAVVNPTQPEPAQSDEPPLKKLADWASKLPPIANSPGDAAAQHDHYLYGAPKRP